MSSEIKRLKISCYTANVSMAIVGSLSPLLFLTFRSLYGISYSLLGLLVLINFLTQLTVDLIFSFFSHKFNIAKAVKNTPLLTLLGLLIYALWPTLSPSTAYAGLVVGTIIFSAASGFNEVLISPVIAAIPSPDPDREMSKLHSIYAWGVVGAVLFSTVFLLVFGSDNWFWLVLILAIEPAFSFAMFSAAKIPRMETPEKASGAVALLKNKTLWLCVIAIFLGGASECTMAQWSSGYLEQSLSIPKVWGDIFGVALFGLMLGLGRSLYAKIGKNITRVLFLGTIGATICYLITAITSIPVLGLFTCAFTGFCTSMLWPGSLVVASDRIQDGGVFTFAMMAAGGDLGASIGPQLIGIVTDAALANPTIISFAEKLDLAPEQLGMKLGMLIGMLFPLAAVAVFGYIHKTVKKM